MKFIQKPTVILAVCLLLLVGTDYLNAWTAAPPNAPSGNVAAPINTSGTSQTKTGQLNAGILTSFSLASFVDPNNKGGIVYAQNHMRSDKYCDAAGANCFLPTDVTGGGGGGGGSPLPTCANGQILKYNGGSWSCSNFTAVVPVPQQIYKCPDLNSQNFNSPNVCSSNCVGQIQTGSSCTNGTPTARQQQCTYAPVNCAAAGHLVQ